MGQMAHLLSVIFTVFIDPQLMQARFCHNTPIRRIVHSIERSTCKEMYAVKAEGSLLGTAGGRSLKRDELVSGPWTVVDSLLQTHQEIGPTHALGPSTVMQSMQAAPQIAVYKKYFALQSVHMAM